MNYLVELSGVRYRVQVQGERVTVDGVEHQAAFQGSGDPAGSMLILNGRTFPLVIEPGSKGRWAMFADGERVEVEVAGEATVRARAGKRDGGQVGSGTGQADLKAPMPGLVVRVLVSPGQEFGAGTSLVVLEAMKMENELKASGAGVVKEVLVAERQTVERGQVLIRLGPAPA